MRQQLRPCAGGGRPPVTAFPPHRCSVCDAYVYLNARGRVTAHDLAPWDTLAPSTERTV